MTECPIHPRPEYLRCAHYSDRSVSLSKRNGRIEVHEYWDSEYQVHLSTRDMTAAERIFQWSAARIVPDDDPLQDEYPEGTLGHERAQWFRLGHERAQWFRHRDG